MLIAPSILSADFGDLLNDIHKTEEGGADYIHVDVMDGHFVPNISFGAPVMKSLVGRVSIPFDVHL
ncbi:MAG: ribulose-phosphate 3-epimerase, partial [Firmicutes bacterium]|nr:ribulose-phosphate 3-epimerase [Bacillota bacterium]